MLNNRKIKSIKVGLSRKTTELFHLAILFTIFFKAVSVKVRSDKIQESKKC